MLAVRGAFLGVSASFILSCSEADVPGKLQFETEYVRYFSSGRGELCPDLPDVFASARRNLIAALGFPGQKVDYFRFDTELDVRHSAACRGMERCSNKGAVFSAEEFDPHEVVHALVAAEGRPAAMLAEGIAELAQCNPISPFPPPTTPWQEVAVMQAHEPGSGAVYSGGTLLTKRVLRRFGSAALRSFYRQSSDEPSAAVLAFEYGRAFDESFGAAWSDAAGQPVSRICACEGEPLPTDGSVMSIRETCSGQLRPFTIEQDRDVLVRFSGSAFVERCDGDEEALGIHFPGSAVGQSSLAVARLAPGRYYANFFGSGLAATATDRLWSLQPAGLTFASDCNAAGILVLDETVGAGITLSTPVTSGPLFARVSSPDPVDVIVQADGSRPGGGRVLACSGCPASPDQCSPVPSLGTRFVLTSTTVLVFVPPAGSNVSLRLGVAFARTI